MVYYELPPFRPPTEAHSLLIRATRNCSWNRCEFCSMYKDSKLELRAVEEVKQDIIATKMVADEIREWAWKIGYGDRVGMVARANGILWLDDGVVNNVFIGDSNSIIMNTEDFAQIISFLYQTFPDLERVTSYARAKTLVKKRPDELKTLREAGLSRLHVGLETGDDELLEYVKKGATAEEMIIGGRKAIAAGFELSEYVMPGLGGKERWEQHAVETARVLNEINPHFIRLRTLGLAPDTPLYEKNQRGEFTLQSWEELVIEVRTLIQNLEVTSQLVASDFASNFYLAQIDGKLPEDKDRMLRALDDALEKAQSRARA
ncbi:hypothetical protein ES703_06552 [subsurface metagenome]